MNVKINYYLFVATSILKITFLMMLSCVASFLAAMFVFSGAVLFASLSGTISLILLLCGYLTKRKSVKKLEWYKNVNSQPV